MGNRRIVKRYPTPGTYGALFQGDPQTTTTDYDPTYHTFPVQETNGLGQSMSMGYNYTLSVVTSITDPNGVTTSATYDIFGRLRTIVRPGDEDNPTNPINPTMRFSYLLPTPGQRAAGSRGMIPSGPRSSRSSWARLMRRYASTTTAWAS